MSFSQEIKEELEKQNGSARHCRLAELATILYCFSQEEVLADGSKSLVIVTEHESIARKYFTLLKKAFNIENGLFDGGEPCERTNALVEGRIVGQENYKEMLQALKMWDDGFVDSFKNLLLSQGLFERMLFVHRFHERPAERLSSGVSL